MTDFRDFAPRPDWFLNAACRPDPEFLTDLMFPAGKSFRPGLALCAQCPVRTQCLRYAADREDLWFGDGIWGGLKASERTVSNRTRYASTPKGRAA